MVPSELENLVRIGKLHAASHTEAEVEVLLSRSRRQLEDAKSTVLALESRFTLAYGAAHGLALAALWRRGYRSEDRFTVFECLIHTTQLSSASRRVLVSAHRTRNQMEYEAEDRVDDAFVRSLLAATSELSGLLQ